jgi:hypothetical protein
LHHRGEQSGRDGNADGRHQDLDDAVPAQAAGPGGPAEESGRDPRDQPDAGYHEADDVEVRA